MSRVTVQLDFSEVLDVPTATGVPEFSFAGFLCVGVRVVVVEQTGTSSLSTDRYIRITGTFGIQEYFAVEDVSPAVSAGGSKLMSEPSNKSSRTHAD